MQAANVSAAHAARRENDGMGRDLPVESGRDGASRQRRQTLVSLIDRRGGPRLGGGRAAIRSTGASRWKAGAGESFGGQRQNDGLQRCHRQAVCGHAQRAIEAGFCRLCRSVRIDFKPLQAVGGADRHKQAVCRCRRRRHRDGRQHQPEHEHAERDRADRGAPQRQVCRPCEKPICGRTPHTRRDTLPDCCYGITDARLVEKRPPFRNGVQGRMSFNRPGISPPCPVGGAARVQTGTSCRRRRITQSGASGFATTTGQIPGPNPSVECAADVVAPAAPDPDLFPLYRFQIW